MICYCLVAKLCLTLCDPMDCSPPGSIGLPRQEYLSMLPFPSPGDLPNPGIKSVSPALTDGFFTTEMRRTPTFLWCFQVKHKKWEEKDSKYSFIARLIGKFLLITLQLTKIAEDTGGEGKTVLQAKAMNACDFPRKQPWPAPNCALEWTKLLLCHLRYMWGPKRSWLLLFPISLHDSVKSVSIREINDLPVVIAPKRLFFPSFQNPFFKKKWHKS